MVNNDNIGTQTATPLITLLLQDILLLTLPISLTSLHSSVRPFLPSFYPVLLPLYCSSVRPSLLFLPFFYPCLFQCFLPSLYSSLLPFPVRSNPSFPPITSRRSPPQWIHLPPPLKSKESGYAVLDTNRTSFGKLRKWRRWTRLKHTHTPKGKEAEAW